MRVKGLYLPAPPRPAPPCPLQPLAVVYHQEGGTFGADSQLKKSLMAANRQKFVAKWGRELRVGRRPGAGGLAGKGKDRPGAQRDGTQSGGGEGVEV